MIMELDRQAAAPKRWSNSARQVARLLLRYPILAVIIRKIVRLFQGRYTAGVVGVVINSRGEVLIVEHVFHPDCPWGLPGGWLGWREAPHLAIARELKEETGLIVEVIKPLLVERGYSKTHLDIAFLCIARTEPISLSSELLSYQWIHPNRVPEMLSFHKRSIAAALASDDIEGLTS
jgi:8-oxo-dGTP diphosphatase